MLFPVFSIHSLGEGKPDLLVENITFIPSNPMVYQNVTIEVVVKNNGISGSSEVKGALWMNNNITEVVDIPALKIWSSTTLTMYWTPTTPGDYTISFIADYYQDLDESNESNNILDRNISVTEGEVDLKVDEIIYNPEIPTAGGNVSLKARVKNIGTKNSSPCKGTFYVDGEMLTTVSIRSLDVNESFVTEPVKWIPVERGVYTIRFWVDSTESIDEIDEGNNNLSISINVSSNDTIPPLVTINFAPTYVTEKDNVTFFVNASDESGISYIYLTLHDEPSLIYLSNISYGKNSLSYTCGPFPRKDKIYYYTVVEDKAGNIYTSPTYNFTVESYYEENLTVEISVLPENPTEFDEIYLIARGSYPYGITELSILNYRDNYTMKKEENTLNITFGPLGPFTSGTELAYWAKAKDVDGHVAYSNVLYITIGEVSRRNRKNLSAYEKGMVFLVPDIDWKMVLSMTPISIWNEYNESMLLSPHFEGHVKTSVPSQIRFPTLVYHYENDTAMDVKPIINFLNHRWNASKVVIIGNPPAYLLEKLVAPKPVGAGLYEDQIEIWRTSPSECVLNVRASHVDGLQDAIERRWNFNLNVEAENNTLSNVSLRGFSDNALYQLRHKYWKEINKFVVTQDEYGTTLNAAVYSSILNAPLLIQGHYDIDEIDGKRVYLVGSFSEKERTTIEEHAHVEQHYTLSELQDAIIRAGARNVILVNPLDPWIGDNGYDRVLGFSKFYYKQSMLAPFLAAAKKCVIVEASTLSYTGVDHILQDFIDNSALHTATPHIIILASPAAIPMARPNWPSQPELGTIYGASYVYFEVFNYNDIDIKRVNIRTGESHIFSFPGHQFEPFVTDDLEGCKQIGGQLFGFEKPLRTDSGCKYIDIEQVRSSVGSDGGYIVYSAKTSKKTGNDIHMSQPVDRGPAYTYIEGNERILVNTTADETKPDIYTGNPGFIVWQQRNNNRDDWDIHYMIFGEDTHGKLWFGSNIGIEERKNQINPSVYDGKIVYQDDRNGNWDIYVYDVNSQNETRITFDENEQILPEIHRDIVVWQDNRNGNWDVYMHDLSTGVTKSIASSPNPEVRPNLNENWIVWYEKTKDGLWHLWAYEIATGLKKEIDTTMVSHEDTELLFLQADNRFYSSKNNNGHMDYPTGRIFGLSTSDLSAYIMSDIFFDKMEKNRYALIIARGLSEEEKRTDLLNYTRTFWTDEVRNEFTCYSIYVTYAEVEFFHDLIVDKFSESYLTIFYDHGNNDLLGGFVSSQDLETGNYSKTPSFLLNTGCLTAGYYLSSNRQWLFVTHVLRSGRMNCLGFVDLGIAWYRDGEIICDAHGLNPSILNHSFLDDKTIGESYKIGKNCCRCGSDVVILLGDPTIKPRWWS